MTNNFGKLLRKLRIENDEKLRDMAKKLGVSIAYLSYVERGDRNIPLSWIDLLPKFYKITSDDLLKAKEES